MSTVSVCTQKCTAWITDSCTYKKSHICVHTDTHTHTHYCISQKQDRVDELQERIDRHKFHVQKLEVSQVSQLHVYVPSHWFKNLQYYTFVTWRIYIGPIHLQYWFFFDVGIGQGQKLYVVAGSTQDTSSQYNTPYPWLEEDTVSDYWGKPKRAPH